MSAYKTVKAATLFKTLKGGNHGPTLAAVGVQKIADTADSGVKMTLKGQLLGQDSDHCDHLTYSLAGSGTSDYGQLKVAANGQWTFVTNPCAVDALGTGQSTKVSFMVQVTDQSGAKSSTPLVIQITGSNDTPTLAAVAVQKIVDTADSGVQMTLKGQLLGKDSDHCDQLTYSLAGSGTSGYGQLKVAANGQWTFVANPSAVDALGEGQSTKVSFMVQVTDQSGARASTPLVIQITGSNESNASNHTPTLAAVAVQTIVDTAGADAQKILTGQLLGQDSDSGAASLSYALVGSGTSDYGQLSVAANGQWTFTSNPGAVDALGAGQNVQASFTVQASDPSGAKASTPLVIQITGSNDMAQITGNASGSVAEDGVGSTHGTLAVTDRDSGESAFGSVGSLVGNYGDFTFDQGAWTYLLRNDAENVQALNSSETVYDTLLVKSTDGSAVNISVAVSGADEKVGINLTPANDTYTIGAGDYVINGLGGNDTITTGAGNTTINLLVGNSTITMGAGNGTVNSVSGNNTITMGAGNSIIKTGDGNNTITTGDGSSTINTGKGDNTITTGNGDSTVHTLGGNNTITTGNGNDIITTGNGNDTITAGAGADVIFSGAGNDTITLGVDSAIDTVMFGANAAANGNDIIAMFTTGIDKLNFDAMTTQIFATAVAGNLTVNTGGVYFLATNTAGNADSLAASAAVLQASANWTNGVNGDMGFFVVTDDDSSAIYQYVEAGGAGISVSELTLMGIVDAKIAVTDLVFG